jgi:uncharacterized protein
MDKISIFLACIVSLLALCQWFVFTSVRKRVFKRYTDITRKTAYITLAIIGAANILAARLTFDPDPLAGHALTKEVVSVVFFSWLGFALALSLFFLALNSFVFLMDLPGYAYSLVRSLRSGPKPFRRHERGCVGSFRDCENPGEIAKGQCECPPEDSAIREEGQTRRTFLQISAAAGVALTAAAAAGGISEAFEKPVLEEFDFFHHGLDGLTSDITIIQVTDFHFGMFFGESQLKRLVEELNAVEADALFITGDVFHTFMTPVEESIPILKGLKPRRLGNYAILGNHDFYAGEQRSVNALGQGGLTLLRNRWLSFREGGANIHVGGIDDPMVNWVWGAKFPKFNEFMASAPKEPGFRLLLSHRPNILPYASEAKIDLTLTGHIHGGQIILPEPGNARGLSLAAIVSKYTNGWYKEHGSSMYLNRGVGLTFIPWRINCPPEIALLRLKPSQGEPDRVQSSRSGKTVAI